LLKFLFEFGLSSTMVSLASILAYSSLISAEE